VHHLIVISLTTNRILVILDFEVLAEYGEFEKIGEPQALEATAKSDVQETKPQTSNISGSNFYGNKPQGQQQNNQPLPSRATGGAAGGVRESSHGNIYPIEALSPYAHKWTIKARCTFKSEIKTWHNKNGEGKLFSVNLLDASGEIRATGFNDAVDSWYEILEEGSVYYITAPCRVQPAKKQFSNVNNDYELTFERETQIEKADDNEGVPTVQYNFTSLGDLQNIEKDTTIDAIGVLQEVGEVSEIVSKTTSKPFSKRELTLVDNTGFSARLTIWGASAQSFNVEPQSVIAFKGLKVSDFGGRSLSLLSSGSMSIDPDIDEAAKLKGWYDAQGRNETYQTHASVMASTGGGGGGKDQTKTIAQVRDENLGMTENSDYFTLKATVVYIKQDNIAYPACLTEGCNKKVTNDDEGVWRCEKCNVTHPKPDYRYIMSVNVSDHTGMLWLSCFDDAGKLIMGRSANDIMAAKEEGEDTKVSEMFQQANCTTLIFRCRAKMDSFQDQQRWVFPYFYLSMSIHNLMLIDMLL